MGYLEDLKGKNISINGVPVPDRKMVDFVSSGVSAQDSPAQNKTIINIDVSAAVPFDSVSDLRTAVDGLTIGNTARTSDGSTWLIEAVGAHVDNGGTIVTGSVNAALRQYDGPIAAKWFGATGDGSTDDTAALFAFYSACIATGDAGHIAAGTYCIDLGALAFDNGHAETPLPYFGTDGPDSTIFKANANTDAAFLAFTNGTATSGSGNFWQGGGHGGLSFVLASGANSGSTGQNGLELTGVQYARFGHMRAESLAGSVVKLPQSLFGGSNPDPYHVLGCVFDVIEARETGSYAFYNDNYVGFTGCTIESIRALSNGGGLFGMGAANSVGIMSLGSVENWAIGDQADVTGGASSRFTLGAAEFDNVENGIDTRRAADCEFNGVRFVHRYQTTPNAAAEYWPRAALMVGSAARPTTNVRFGVTDRIEAGGTKPDIGSFADFNSGAGQIKGVTIRRDILDNAGFGFTNEDLYDNASLDNGVDYVRVDTDEIVRNTLRLKNLARARSSGWTVPSGGFGGGSNWVAYDTLVYGATSNYDTGAYEFTAPGDGWYRITARINLALPAATRVRLGIYENASLLTSKYSYAVTANTESHELTFSKFLVRGDVIKVSADQNSGAGVALGTFTSANDNLFTVEPSGG
jgi:hypothetical protein